MGNETRSEWLTRRQVARLMALNEKQVAALDGVDLHPVRRADRSWAYDPAELVAFVGGKASGSLTSRVFAMFREGKSLADVAIDCVQPARRIRDLRVEYDEFVGFLTIDRAVLDQLKAILGSAVIRDGAHLVEVVRAQLEARHQRGFDEGRADVMDLGEVFNQKTQKRKKVPPR
jgi:hypothetical protein